MRRINFISVFVLSLGMTFSSCAGLPEPAQKIVISDLEIGESVLLEVAEAEIPDCRAYDLSETMLCRAVWNYEYDGADRLVKSTKYLYAENNVPGLHKWEECYYTYDQQGRVSEETAFHYRFAGLHHPERNTNDYEVTKKLAAIYEYLPDGGYTRTETMSVNDYTETRSYAPDGRLLKEITAFRRKSFHRLL